MEQKSYPQEKPNEEDKIIEPNLAAFRSWLERRNAELHYWEQWHKDRIAHLAYNGFADINRRRSKQRL